MKLSHLAFGLSLSCTLLAPSMTAQTLDNELIVGGLSEPIWCGSPPGDHDRIFVGERFGQIRIVRNGAILPTPFLSQSVSSSPNERGLLGIAFHPNYDNNGFFYVQFTRTGDSASMVVRYQVSAANPDVADPASATTMLGPISQPSWNHNGGGLEFGPDGYLYVAIGDGGGAGDTACNAQNGQRLLGKMLRVDVDANPNGPAVAPASNPFVGNPAFNDLIWAYGLRNPWRFSFDRETGDMWIGDVGQNTLEEVNFAPASSTGGENYGWKIMEGTNCYSTSNCSSPPACNSATLTDPVRTLPTSSNCSVIGGYVYRGCAIPGLRGTYFHADYCSGRIYTFEYVGGQLLNLMDRTSAIGGGGSLRSFGEDADGEILYVAGSSLYRIVPVGILVNSVAGPGSVGSNGETPVYEICGVLGTGNRATLRVRGAPANAPAALIFGASANPVPLPIPGFGSLVPVPADFTVPVTTDANGEARLEIDGGGSAIRFFHQVAILDAGLGGVTLSNALDTFFNVQAPPTLSTVSPLSATVGAVVSINGTNFQPGATVTVGASPVTANFINDTLVQFNYPAGVGCDSTVTLTNPDGQGVSTAFNPTPTVTNTINNVGPAAGGTSFIIVGSGYSPGTTVTIGGAAATVTSTGPGVLITTTPPGSVGPATVQITTPGGCGTTTTYTYN